LFDNWVFHELGILEVSSKSEYSPHIYQDVMTILFALVIKFYFRKYWYNIMHINNVSFGSITIDQKIYTNDIYITADYKIEKRNKELSTKINGHRCLGKSKIEYLLKFSPKIIIIGTGLYGALPIDPDAKELLDKNKIEIVVDKTPRVIDKLNDLLKKNAKICAIIHITC